jgi:hypothetical protein
MKPFGAMALTFHFKETVGNDRAAGLLTKTAGPRQAENCTNLRPAPRPLGSIEEVTAHAIKDAQQALDPTLQQEALAWLWVCCPDLADELGLPLPATDPPVEIAHYLERLTALVVD